MLLRRRAFADIRKTAIVHLCLYVLLCSMIKCYSTPGSSDISSVCGSMIPGHASTSPQTSKPPFIITFNPKEYTPNGKSINVSIKACSSTGFAGFMIQARSAVNDKNVEGTFEKQTGTVLKCSNKAVLHSDNSKKLQISVLWKPPLQSKGPLIFRASMVESYNNYWVTINSKVIAAKNDKTSGKLVTETTVDPQCLSESRGSKGLKSNKKSAASIELKRSVKLDANCGKTKGCFSDCEDQVCSFLVTWEEQTDSGRYTISVAYNKAPNMYVALGFSADRRMGKDSVTGCVSDNDAKNSFVFNGWNPKGYSATEMMLEKDVLLESVSRVDGVFKCVFKRPKKLKTLQYDLTKKWTLLLVYGKASNVSEKPIISKHVEELLSHNAVSVADKVHIGSTPVYFALTHTHGLLMVLSWMLFSSIGLILARYYKTAWSKKFFGLAAWFVFHRFFMGLVSFFTIIAFIVIFADIQGWSNLKEENSGAQAHPFIGLYVVLCAVVNPIMAWQRPGKDSPYRIYFYWAHFLVGVTAQLFAVMNMFFGIELSRAHTPDIAAYILGVYVVWMVIVSVQLELLKWKEKSIEEQQVPVLHRPESEVVMTAVIKEQLQFHESHDAKEQKEQINVWKSILIGAHSFMCFTLCMITMAMLYKNSV